MNPVDKILSKQKIVYQDEDGQIHTSSDGGYDIVIFGKTKQSRKEKYARLLSKLKKGDM
jgi:hypothetical protein